MKKVFSMLLVLMALISSVAMAAGSLEITQETYIPLERYEDSFAGNVFAEITNTGDEVIGFSKGQFEILDAQGNALDWYTLYSCYPSVIVPGGKAYVYDYEYVDGATSVDELPGYTLQVSGEEPYYDAPVLMTVSSAEVVRETDTWGDEVYNVYVTIANDGEETAFVPTVSYGLYDADGALLYAGATTMYSMGIPAGQSSVVFFTVEEAFLPAWDAAGVAPTTVGALAYME